MTPLDHTGVCNIGTSIESFIEEVSDTDNVVYFHNLGFDIYFILDFILRDGFTHVVTDSRDKGQFTTLISKMGSFYSVTVRWRSGHTTEFRDSYKKIPLSVAAIAGAFNMDMTKGEIDYDAYRAPGHELTAEERDYLERDVKIVAKALKVQIDSGMNKLTVGADSLAEYKKIKGTKTFRRIFPVLPTMVDSEIRVAYRGGFTYADPRFQGEIQGQGRVYDVNSLYPYVMHDFTLPYGEPVWCDGLPETNDDYPLFTVSITFTAKLRPDHIPCIQIKGSSFFLNTEYVHEIKEPITLTVTNVDLELWSQQYEMDIISYNGGYLFHGAVGLFNEYIDKWMGVKSKYSGGLRLIAKLHLNSLYGKFATNPDVTGKYPALVDNVVKLVDGEEQFRDPVYTPMGVFITSYARSITINAAQENYSTFAYADTDSLHLLTDRDPDTLEVHPTKLGAWKREGIFTRAMYVRAKAYMEQMEDGTYSTHIAGLPKQAADLLTFENLYSGAHFKGKLSPKRVPGGVVLTDVGYTLKM